MYWCHDEKNLHEIFLDKMNYVKQFWVSRATTSATVDSQQSFNSVALTTPTNIPIFHTNSSLKPEMTVSPTDSFHSTSSTFEEMNEKGKGNVNKGYTGSSGDLNGIEHQQHQMQPHQHNQ